MTYVRPEEQQVVPVLPIRVLIADDDHRVRIALSTLLTTSADFEVVGAAGTAAGALTLAREHRPTVALIDMHLPDPADGLGLLRAISGELHIPAIAISVDGGLANNALAAGAADFFDKDGIAERLISALRTVASSRHGVR
ncbi:response regulator transcription factor [Nocardioides immobilis]|uniref:response regulator transcription factor n=1 Tax=Nocardioides immobilis TaxID=2049295 RepID=UPI0015F8DA48|nr:response regulator [Nocardioides immobilis]